MILNPNAAQASSAIVDNQNIKNPLNNVSSFKKKLQGLNDVNGGFSASLRNMFK